jgi:hypothetical protein
LQQTYTPTTSQDYKKVVGTMKNQIELYSLVDDIGQVGDCSTNEVNWHGQSHLPLSCVFLVKVWHLKKCGLIGENKQLMQDKGAKDTFLSYYD